MKVINSVRQLRDELRDARVTQKRIGLVPTMGFLHKGHVSLFEQARRECDLVTASVFVNPLQFGPSEDFEVYPRDTEGDIEVASRAGVDILFMPPVEEMYSRPPFVTVSVREVTTHLCGRSRPGHFDGVATVVAKLFNIVQPHVAFFGAKDAQQVAVIRRLVQDLDFDIEIVRCPIVRESDGLAVSSRNVYLSAAQREQATVLYRALAEADRLVNEGETNARKLVDNVTNIILTAPNARIDYVELVEPNSLQPIDIVTGSSLLALAVYFEDTRLIDNIILNPVERVKSL